MLGREVSVPADLVFRPPKPAKVVDHEEYVTRLQESIRTAHEVARAVLKTYQVHMKRDYDVKIHTREYAIGNFVYVLDSAKTKGRSMKLDPPWKDQALLSRKYFYTSTSQTSKLSLCNQP